MKKIILFFFVSMAAMHSFAQDGKKSNVIKLNPLGALFGSANFSFEHALNDNSSISVNPSLGFLKSSSFKYSTYGLGAQYRYYFKGEAPKGVYTAAGVGYSFGSAKYTLDNSTSSVSGFNGEALFGKQWIWGSGFVLDLNGGVQYVNLKFKATSGAFALYEPLSGILPSLNLSLGYNF